MFGIFKKKPKSMLDQFITAAYGERPPAPRRANVELATELAHSQLLMGLVEKGDIRNIAQGLFDGDVPYSTHDLATATALNFFMRPEMKDKLEKAQLMARMSVLEWFTEGNVIPLLLKSLEDNLYKSYK